MQASPTATPEPLDPESTEASIPTPSDNEVRVLDQPEIKKMMKFYKARKKKLTRQVLNDEALARRKEANRKKNKAARKAKQKQRKKK